MTIIKVHGLDVEAEVRGVLRRVTWREDDDMPTGSLMVHDLTYAEAMVVLTALGTGVPASVTTQAGAATRASTSPLAPPYDPTQGGAPRPPAADPVQTGKRVGEELVETAKKRTRKAPPAEVAPPEDPPAAAAPPPPAAAAQTPPPAAEAAPSAPVAPPAAPLPKAAPPPVGTPPSAPAAIPQAAASSATGAATVHCDLEILRRASTVRAIISHLMEHGVEPKDVVGVCTGIKDEVPVLSRIADLPDRLGRALDIMGINLAAAAPNGATTA